MIVLNMEEVMEVESGMDAGTRKPTDMNAPKRPMRAFFQKVNMVRPSITKEHPEWNVEEISWMLGSRWKALPKSEIEGYQAKKVFDRKMEKYKMGANYRKYQTEMLAWRIHETKKPFPEDLNAPKRSPFPYMLYAASVRDQIMMENPELTSAEVMNWQSVWWKALSAAQRRPWNEKSAKGMAKYDKQLAKYQKTIDYQEYMRKKAAYKSMMVAKRNELLGIKPPMKKRARNEDMWEPETPSIFNFLPRRSSSRRSSRSASRRSRSMKSKDAKRTVILRLLRLQRLHEGS